MSRGLIEGCVDSYASAVAAVRDGADRLELCGHLAIGGVTPSPVVFRQIRRDCDVPINVLIRPRFGDFLYSDVELEEMREEIEMFRALGANGVVTGVLTPDGSLDKDALGRLLDCGGGMEATLHRAFDMTRDPFAALETAVDLGFRTILSSGQAASAPQGMALLAQLNRQAAGRLVVMAGCGVKSGNIPALHNGTGICVFHTSAKRVTDSGMIYRKASVSMGLPSLSEYELWQTDEAEFRRCAQLVHAL